METKISEKVREEIVKNLEWVMNTVWPYRTYEELKNEACGMVSVQGWKLERGTDEFKACLKEAARIADDMKGDPDPYLMK